MYRIKQETIDKHVECGASYFDFPLRTLDYQLTLSCQISSFPTPLATITSVRQRSSWAKVYLLTIKATRWITLIGQTFERLSLPSPEPPLIIRTPRFSGPSGMARRRAYMIHFLWFLCQKYACDCFALIFSNSMHVTVSFRSTAKQHAWDGLLLIFYPTACAEHLCQITYQYYGNNNDNSLIRPQTPKSEHAACILPLGYDRSSTHQRPNVTSIC